VVVTDGEGEVVIDGEGDGVAVVEAEGEAVIDGDGVAVVEGDGVAVIDGKAEDDRDGAELSDGEGDPDQEVGRALTRAASACVWVVTTAATAVPTARAVAAEMTAPLTTLRLPRIPLLHWGGGRTVLSLPLQPGAEAGTAGRPRSCTPRASRAALPASRESGRPRRQPTAHARAR